MLVFKNNSLSLETYLVLDFTLLTHLAHKNSLNMCWTFNHQNTYRNGPRAHFPFNDQTTTQHGPARPNASGTAHRSTDRAEPARRAIWLNHRKMLKSGAGGGI
jgi:hypothetical protein